MSRMDVPENTAGDYCHDCPDREACSQGWACRRVKELAVRGMPEPKRCSECTQLEPDHAVGCQKLAKRAKQAAARNAALQPHKAKVKVEPVKRGPITGYDVILELPGYPDDRPSQARKFDTWCFTRGGVERWIARQQRRWSAESIRRASKLEYEYEVMLPAVPEEPETDAAPDSPEVVSITDVRPPWETGGQAIVIDTGSMIAGQHSRSATVTPIPPEAMGSFFIPTTTSLSTDDPAEWPENEQERR
jgi:hypothetical protein